MTKMTKAITPRVEQLEQMIFVKHKDTVYNYDRSKGPTGVPFPESQAYTADTIEDFLAQHKQVRGVYHAYMFVTVHQHATKAGQLYDIRIYRPYGEVFIVDKGKYLFEPLEENNACPLSDLLRSDLEAFASRNPRAEWLVQYPGGPIYV